MLRWTCGAWVLVLAGCCCSPPGSSPADSSPAVVEHGQPAETLAAPELVGAWVYDDDATIAYAGNAAAIARDEKAFREATYNFGILFKYRHTFENETDHVFTSGDPATNGYEARHKWLVTARDGDRVTIRLVSATSEGEIVESEQQWAIVDADHAAMEIKPAIWLVFRRC